MHLAEHSKGSIDSKYVNGISDSDLFISGGRDFQTLSGCEAADDQNGWDNFKHIIADEDFQLNATPNSMVVANEGCGHVTLMVSVEDTGIGILLHAQNRVFMPFMELEFSYTQGFYFIECALKVFVTCWMGNFVAFVQYILNIFSQFLDLDRCQCFLI